MKDEDKVVESFEEAMKRIMARMSPEQRLAGLAPEQRLAGLAPEQVLRAYAPEQRLAGLTEAEAVLALPDAALRGLSKEYVATLPREAQTAIEKRLGAPAAVPRQPARRRKAR